MSGRVDACIQWEKQCLLLDLIKKSTLFQLEKQKSLKVVIQEAKSWGDSYSSYSDFERTVKSWGHISGYE